MPSDFDTVQLTPEETELAIFDARCEKYWRTKKEREQAELIRRKEQAKTPWTADELANFVLTTNAWFKLDDQARPVFELLCQYFSGDPRFESAGYSLKKGICLSGPVGVGKTELLNIFRKNKRQCFHLLSVFDIENILQEKGIDQIQSFYGSVPGWNYNKEMFYQPSIGWAFDDVGRESIVFDFGNKTDAISKIIQSRYFHKRPFTELHITTNKTPAELEKRYDDAVRSRLREMFNYITYSGADRRR